ncbi:MAG: N-acetyltransferase family protein [Candidatus Binataceae bacterium]
MSEVVVRPARRGDLARVTEIYNHYVVNTPITFDIEPFTVEQRVSWFEEHAESGRYRLLVAERSGMLLGYAGTGQFRAKAAYDTSVEMTIYCAPEAMGRAIGTRLYAALFDQLEGEDIHRALAGITLPNDASIALHRKFGFKEVAHFTENGRKLGRYWDVLWMEKAMG